MSEKRIDILKNILMDLHNGASPESVQDQFNQHFTGVSALEISLMEHELMSSDTGITFEDVCSVTIDVRPIRQKRRNLVR